MTSVFALLPTRREELLARLAKPCCFDLAVIGGGATGLEAFLALAQQYLHIPGGQALDLPKLLCNNRGLRVSSVKFLPSGKCCKWFAVRTTGPRLTG
ncbi:MAG: hypothetical protein WA129_14425 [Acidovorax sp.]